MFLGKLFLLERKSLQKEKQFALRIEMKVSLMDFKNSLVFVLKFFLIFSVLQTLIYVIELNFLLNGLAEFVGFLLNLIVVENSVYFNGTLFTITPNCTGLVSVSVFAGIVFALKKPGLKKKFLIFLTGSVLLFLINIVRIYLVVLSGVLFNLSELTHVVSWFAMTFFIIFTWFYLTKKIFKIKKFEGFI